MWIIGLPAWGEHYADIALRAAIPSIIASADYAGKRVRFVIHTDRPDRFAGAFGSHLHEERLVPGSLIREQFCEMHDEVLRLAEPGDRVALLNADHLMSIECIEACEHAFDLGHNLVAIATLRAVDHRDLLPPSGSKSGTVIDYALDHPHSITEDCTWPTGASNAPTLIVFRNGGNAAVNAFHLHPLALVARPGLAYRGSVDVGLMSCFSRDEIHVVRDRDVCSMIEVSPVDKRIAAGCADTPNDARRVARFARVGVSNMHRWFFSQRITLRGSLDAEFSNDPVPEIMALINEGDCIPSELMTGYAPEIFLCPELEKAREACFFPSAGLPVDERWEKETAWLLERILPLPRGLVLDIGCGLGRLAKPICERGNPVLGVEMSPTMRSFSEELVAKPERFTAITPSMLHHMVTHGVRASAAIAIWSLNHMPSSELSRMIDLLGEALPTGAILWTLDHIDRHIPVWLRYEFGYWAHGWADDGYSTSYMLSTRFFRVGEEPLGQELGMRGPSLRRWTRR